MMAFVHCLCDLLRFKLTHRSNGRQFKQLVFYAPRIALFPVKEGWNYLGKGEDCQA